MRRRDVGSFYRTTEKQDEIRNGRTSVNKKRFRLSVYVFYISLVLMAPHFTSSQDKSQCLPRCWNKASKDVSFTNGVHLETIAEEGDCKNVCFNNETCIGVFWGFDRTLMNVSCWLQMSFSGTLASLRNANYWNVTSCSDDCFPYCWLPKWVNVQAADGVSQKGVTTEGQCKSKCSDDQTCNGVDWDDSESSCNLLISSELRRNSVTKPIHHWEIIRNLPVNCLLEYHNVSNVSDGPVVVEPLESSTLNASMSQTNASNETISDRLSSALESALGFYISLGRDYDVGFNSTFRCPTYMPGIIALSTLMGVSCLMIIGLLAYIVHLHLELARLVNLLALRSSGFRGYQSIGTIRK